jgi:pyrroline-5-carboxylate reductase
MTTPRAKAALDGLGGAIVLVGAGKMGGAMLDGWLGLGLEARRLVVLEPQPTDAIVALTRHGLRLNPAPAAVGEVAALVLAIKPQNAREALPGLAPLVGAATVVISIMAGRTLRFIEAELPPGAAVVRTMPNLPAAVHRAMTVAVPNRRASAAQRELVDALLTAIGSVEWIEDEALMDAVVAVSGSGPAYVFLLAETMTQAGIHAGLPPALAARLARETVAGAGELLQRSPLQAGVLRQNVTSPGGTTAAALEVLMAPDGLMPLMRRAVDAASRRSRELAG